MFLISMKIIIKFLILTINFLLTLFSTKEVVEIKIIENITNPQQVIWKNDNSILFVTDTNLWEYVISEDITTHITTREPNEFVGLDSNGDIVLCGIEHYTISSYDEFSTKFTVKDKLTKKELYFFETIRPIHLDDEKIIAVTALDFLETHYYEIDITSGDKKEIKKPKKKKYALDIPHYIEFKKGYVRNEQRYVIEDIFGNLYIYIKKDLPSKYSDYIYQSFGTFLKK